MAIAVRGSPVTATNASAVNLTLNYASQGMAAGDLVIAVLATDINNNFDGVWAAESGWHRRIWSSSETSGAVFYRLADAGFVSSPSVTFDRNGTAEGVAGAGIILSGVHQTFPVFSIDQMGEGLLQYDPVDSPSQLWAPADGCWSVGGLTTAGGINTGYQPSGYTARQMVNTIGNAHVAIATKALTGTAPISEVPGTWNLDQAEHANVFFLMVVPDTASFGGGSGRPVIKGGFIS